MPIIVVAIIILLVAIGLVAYVAWRSSRRRLGSAVRAKIQNAWQRITVEQDAKHAILEADKLLDYVLKQYGYEGNLGDKLKKAGSLFSNPDGVWRAHKVRNRIAHEMEFHADDRLRQECLRAFKQALDDLKVL